MPRSPLSTQERESLLAAARQALPRAYARYSNFRVGAAVLTEQGEIFPGCNVENASYGLTICAERSAIFTAVHSTKAPQLAIRADGGRPILELVRGDGDGFVEGENGAHYWGLHGAAGLLLRAPRADGTLAVLLQHRWHTLWGIAGAAICWSISPAVFAWMSPIIIGLLLAALIARLTAAPAGQRLADLLATPEERCPPALLLSRSTAQRAWCSVARIAASQPASQPTP